VNLQIPRATLASGYFHRRRPGLTSLTDAKHGKVSVQQGQPRARFFGTIQDAKTISFHYGSALGTTNLQGALIRFARYGQGHDSRLLGIQNPQSRTVRRLAQLESLPSFFVKHANRWTLVGHQQLGTRPAQTVDQHELFGLNGPLSVGPLSVGPLSVGPLLVVFQPSRIRRLTRAGWRRLGGRRWLRLRRCLTLGTCEEDDGETSQREYAIRTSRPTQFHFESLQTLF
jgi:hypothetical protein